MSFFLPCGSAHILFHNIFSLTCCAAKNINWGLGTNEHICIGHICWWKLPSWPSLLLFYRGWYIYKTSKKNLGGGLLSSLRRGMIEYRNNSSLLVSWRSICTVYALKSQAFIPNMLLVSCFQRRYSSLYQTPKSPSDQWRRDAAQF